MRFDNLQDALNALNTDKKLTSIELIISRVHHAKELAEILKKNKTLLSLNLSGSIIRNEGATAIAEALETNKTLTSIDLGSTEIKDVTAIAQALAKALKTNMSLTALDLGGKYIDASSVTAIAEALKTNSSLTWLSFHNNKSGDSGATTFAEALKMNDTLVSLNLGANKIGEAGGKAIAEAIKKNKTLTSLKLHHNKIGDIASGDIASAIKINTTITSLDLSSNEIGDVAATQLADALKTNKTITWLSLSGNKIGNEGTKKLAEALKTNTTLESIYLRDNKIDAAGAQEIAKALKTNKTLRSIDLEHNTIGETAATAIAEALEKNYFLTSIEIDRINISEETIFKIKQFIERNIKVQRKISYEKARNMVSQKEDPQAVLLALKTALTFAEQINDEASIKEFEQHIPLYEILALFQETGIHGMRQWKTIIEGAFQSDPTILYSDPLPGDPSYDTHLQAAIRQHREKADPSLNNRKKLIKLYNAIMALSQLEDPRAEEAFHDLKQDFKIMNNMLRYKYISEILAPLKQLGIFELARTATQATKDQESLTILYDSYRKLSKLSDPCAKMAMNQLKRDLDTADAILRLKLSNK